MPSWGMCLPPKGLRGRSCCFARVILDGECVCLYLKTGFSVSCAVFYQLVAMEKSAGAGSSVPLCVSISGPASCLSLLQMEGHRVPLGTDPFSASRFPWGKGDAFLYALTQQLDPECLRVLGIVLGLSVQRRRAGAQASPGRILPVCPITPSLPVPLLHVIPTSEFQGLSLFLLQPWYLLIWNLHSWTSFPLPAAPSPGPGQRRALTQDPSVVKSFLWRLRMSVCPVFLPLI